MRKINSICIAILIIVGNTFGQDTIKVMTYNVLNYPSKISSFRNPHFKTILSSVSPDILVVQEMESSTGVSLFLEQALDTTYTAGEFIDGTYDTENALYYKVSKFDFLDNTPIKTALRDISQLTFRHKITSDTLIIFSAHLKASSGSENEQKRLAEVLQLRNVTDQLPIGTNYMMVGDFNFYSSNEPGYQALVDQDNSGYFLDPINKFGTWHNSSSYRAIHTQSTRLTNLADEGSTGGLDDRFDFILVSQAVLDPGGITILPDSYKSYGNDGNHFNRAMIEFPNSSVSDEIAEALYYASDHLPVIADIVFENIPTAIENDIAIINNFDLKQNYPNPFNPSTTISYSIPSNTVISNPIEGERPVGIEIFPNGRNDKMYITLKVYDVLGRAVRTLVDSYQKPGQYSVKFNAENLSSGLYFYSLKFGTIIATKKMMLLK